MNRDENKTKKSRGDVRTRERGEGKGRARDPTAAAAVAANRPDRLSVHSPLCDAARLDSC